MWLERDGDGFCIDAGLLGRLLDLPARRVQELLRQGVITSVCERGEGIDDGRYRLRFFHGSRHVQLDVEANGHVIRRSVIDRAAARARYRKPDHGGNNERNPASAMDARTDRPAPRTRP
jgi:hypothetical protein